MSWFRKKEEEKIETKKLYKLVLDLSIGDEKHYTSSAVLDEIMQIAYSFGSEVEKSEFNNYNKMSVCVWCTYVEIHMLISKLRERFPKIEVKDFRIT